MCYNCGCGKPDDPMGKGHAGVDPEGKSITTKTFEAAAESQGQTKKQAMQHALELLQKTTGQEADKS